MRGFPMDFMLASPVHTDAEGNNAVLKLRTIIKPRQGQIMKSKSQDGNLAGHHRAPGFTLIEMLLVLVILGILAAIVYPNVIKHGPESRIKATKVQISAFRTALEVFHVENGHFPTGSSGLKDLVQRPNATPDWHGPYIDKIPKDPWEHDYIYTCPGKHNVATFDLMSLGPDGVAGTADDITNWE